MEGWAEGSTPLYSSTAERTAERTSTRYQPLRLELFWTGTSQSCSNRVKPASQLIGINYNADCVNHQLFMVPIAEAVARGKACHAGAKPAVLELTVSCKP